MNLPAPAGIDTVEKFNWEIDTFYYPLADVYPIDTSNYYMTFSSLPYLIHYNHGIKKYIDLGAPNFRGGPIKAKNESKIFVGGMIYGCGDTRAHLRVVENGSVSSYPIPDDSTQFVGIMFIDGQDNLWLSTFRKIYRFKDGIFKKYPMGDSLTYCRFYEDNSNQLFAFCVNDYGYPINYKIKKITGDSAITVYEEKIYSYGQKYCGVENTCLNNDLILSSAHTLYVFSNYEWSSFYTNNDLFFRANINGISRNYLICFLDSYHVNGKDNVGLIYDNGKLQYERKLVIGETETPARTYFINENTVFSFTVIPTRLFIGTRKQSES